MDFSIIITTHNRPHMLPRALSSAFRQTFDRYEVILVDDFSDSPIAVEAAVERKFTLVRAPRRLGFAGAINLCAEHATGDWLAFLDDDDEYEPDFLGLTYARRKETPERHFSWCSATFLHYDGNEFPMRNSVRRFGGQFDTEDDLLAASVSIGSGNGFSVKSDVFQRLGGFDSQNFGAIADTEFFWRLIATGHRPFVVPELLVRVHKHSGPRMTDSHSYRNRLRQCQLLRSKYADLIRQHPRLGEIVTASVTNLSALALAAEAQQRPPKTSVHIHPSAEVPECSSP